VKPAVPANVTVFAAATVIVPVAVKREFSVITPAPNVISFHTIPAVFQTALLFEQLNVEPVVVTDVAATNVKFDAATAPEITTAPVAFISKLLTNPAPFHPARTENKVDPLID
jgi:hypothetical protein